MSGRANLIQIRSDFNYCSVNFKMDGILTEALRTLSAQARYGNHEAEVTGEVELQGSVLILRRITTLYKLRAPEAHREVIERIHSIHSDHCPVARSLEGAIECQTYFELVPSND